MKKTLLCIILIALGLTINAQITYVNINATGLNNGSSWVNAYTDLHSATYNTTTGAIWVAQGTYTPTKDYTGVIPTNICQQTFRVRFNVKVYGGFVGTETLLTQRNWKNNPTILSGHLAATTKAYNVVIFDANTNVTEFDGFTVENGQAIGSASTESFGGAINMSNNASPTIRNCRFLNNISKLHGGAIYVFGGTPKFENCEFKNNHTNQYDGGALYINGATSTIIVNCLFNGNVATRHGGALLLINTITSKVWNCTFVNNQRGSGGIGGVILLSATTGNPIMNINNCIFYKNLPSDNGSVNLNAGSYTVKKSYTSVGALCFTSNSGLTNLVSGAPNFTDFSGGDFTLLCNSPAVNAGDTKGLVIPVTDLNGNTRIRGTSIDIGAYENPMTTQTTLVGLGISANQTGATYRWLNCNNSYSVISGETAQTYSPTVNGSYAVEVTLNGCTDTSACSVFSSVSVREFERTSFKLYPNPTSSTLSIKTDEIIKAISIYNRLGELVQTETEHTFSVTQLSSGIYMIHVKTEKGMSALRFIKE